MNIYMLYVISYARHNPLNNECECSYSFSVLSFALFLGASHQSVGQSGGAADPSEPEAYFIMKHV